MGGTSSYRGVTGRSLRGAERSAGASGLVSATAVEPFLLSRRGPTGRNLEPERSVFASDLEESPDDLAMNLKTPNVVRFSRPNGSHRTCRMEPGGRS